MYRPVIAFAMTLCCLGLNAAERKLDRDQLPAAVQKTVDAESKGATLKGFTTEVENGKKVFEAEMIVNGHTRDIQMSPDGTVNEIEEEVALDQVPANVQTSLRTHASGAQIVKVESLTKHGKLVAYEASTISGTHRGEVQVGPDGQSLMHEE